MDISKVRQIKLKELIASYGSQAKLADKLEGVNPGFISQLVTGSRNMGEKLARKIESQLGLSAFYFDVCGETAIYNTALNIQVLIDSIQAVEDAIEIMKQQLTTKDKATLIAQRYEASIKKVNDSTPINADVHQSA